MLKINDIEIECNGTSITTGEMLSKLKNRNASFWHWHTLLEKTKHLYNNALKKEEYGILLPETFNIDGKDFYQLDVEMANGLYDKKRLSKLVKIYKFLLK